MRRLFNLHRPYGAMVNKGLTLLPSGARVLALLMGNDYVRRPS